MIYNILLLFKKTYIVVFVLADDQKMTDTYNLYIKSILGGDGINVSSNLDTVLINSYVTNANISSASGGTGVNLIVQNDGTNVVFASLEGIGGIVSVLNPNTNTVELSLDPNFDTTTLTSLGTGINTVVNSAGPNLEIMSVQGQGQTSVYASGNTLLISSNVVNANLVSLGTGTNIVVNSQGPDLAIMSIDGQNGIVVSTNDNTLILALNSNFDTTNVTSTGTGVNTVVHSAGPQVVLASIQGLNGVDVVLNTNSNTVEISLDANYATSTLTSLGTGTNTVVQGAGPTLEIMSVNTAGTLSQYVVNNTLIISSNVVNTNITSAGTGTNLVVQSQGPDLILASIQGANGVGVNLNNNIVTVSLNSNFDTTTLSSQGIGVNTVINAAGPNLSIMSIQGQNNTNVYANGNTLVVSVNFTDINITGNGTGETMVIHGTGPNLVIKNIAGMGMTMVSTINGNSIVINTPNVNLISVGNGVSLVANAQALGLRAFSFGPGISLFGSPRPALVASSSYVQVVDSDLVENVWTYLAYDDVSTSGFSLTEGQTSVDPNQAGYFSVSSGRIKLNMLLVIAYDSSNNDHDSFSVAFIDKNTGITLS